MYNDLNLLAQQAVVADAGAGAGGSGSTDGGMLALPAGRAKGASNFRAGEDFHLALAFVTITTNAAGGFFWGCRPIQVRNNK